MTKEQMAQMSGEGQYKRPQLLKLKSLKLNGDTGKFVITHLDEEKGADGKYRKEEIDGVPEVVFLKVRRRLIESTRDGLVRSTSEHNSTNDTVVLFNQKDNTTEKGTSKELREKYEVLRTEQIVYCRYNGNIVRLSVKGASLGSNTKAKTTTDFYTYLSSFQGTEHFFETTTKLVPVQEGETRTYWCIDFKRGTLLTDEQLAKVGEDMEKVFNSCKSFDEYYQVATPAKIKEDQQSESAVEYPEEELDAKDIPF